MKRNKLLFRIVIYLMLASMLLTTVMFTINSIL
ncbi:stressosome-associated protein Prli42 [Paenibacillus filicis]|uniref:Stressosome-associated protein Prli42 n=1 Tax=Paenibacillus gyeongsangnamensis TaxID=3388067 RepID=A0ABT4Q7P1_9BACL|nr:stressosome-associated protein Prli42 [Paenibacillus filicis]MCZ8512851.1 stressosome-associated protein Prli42 [Paenibacillus filicis]